MHEKHLQKFCSEILTSFEGGAKPTWFWPGRALCANAMSYDREHETDLEFYLFHLFKGDAYPFNHSIQADYLSERARGAFYSNEKRIAFLKAYAIIEV